VLLERNDALKLHRLEVITYLKLLTQMSKLISFVTTGNHCG